MAKIYAQTAKSLQHPTCDECGSKLNDRNECRSDWCDDNEIELIRDISLTVPVRELGK